MPQDPIVLVHLKDVRLEPDVDERVRSRIARRCQHLADEFHEVTRFEIHLSGNGPGYDVHAHATGKNTDVATHAHASEPAPAADRGLDRIERQLRRAHDKRIFKQRRRGRAEPPADDALSGEAEPTS